MPTPRLSKTLLSNTNFPRKHLSLQKKTKPSNNNNNSNPSDTKHKTSSSSLEAQYQRDDTVDGKIIKTSSSPYYKGLTDSSLVINRLPSPVSSSSFLTFKECSSCFSSKSKKFDNSIDKPEEYSIKPVPDLVLTSSLSSPTTLLPYNSSAKTTSMPCILDLLKEKRVEMDDNVPLLNSYKEKPLRERLLTGSSSRESFIMIVPSKNLAVHDHPSEKERKVDEVINVREFTWANKYRPKVLDDFICNRDKAIQLKTMVREGCGDHFIFDGPPGVGKRTMIRAMLREAFGDEVLEITDECKVFHIKGEKACSIPVNVKASTYHVEVNVSEIMKGHERQVIVELIKEKPCSERSSRKATYKPELCYRGMVLFLSDKLSMDALQYIRWVIEKHQGSKKIFFCCSDSSKLQPVKSLCTVVQLSSPSKEEIVEVLQFIAKQEGIELSDHLARKIADNSKNNFRQAIRSFEASWKKSYPFKEDEEMLSGWEDDIADIAKMIVEEQSSKRLYIVRWNLQNLREHEVSPDYILKSLVKELKRHVGDEFHRRIEGLSVDYNGMFSMHNRREQDDTRHDQDPRRKNVQQFLRIEEFIAKFMSYYKSVYKAEKK